jgi:quinoprotein relay system zinc metallohydrolase 2
MNRWRASAWGQTPAAWGLTPAFWGQTPVFTRVLAPVFAAACAAITWPLALFAQPLADFQIENPAPGVYVHYGVQAEMTPANAGDVANLGFVVGDRCVAVIDTGGTYAVGRALRLAIRRVTSKPVCYVINTHVHPDHVFGNAAFADDAPVFVGHATLAESLRRRGPNYLNALTRDLGAVAAGSALVSPTHGVASDERLDLGGRSLGVRAWKTAHTDGDLTVFDESSGTLWLGDLCFVGHLPVVDGSLRGFLSAIRELRTVTAQRVVPGHGRAPAWPAAIAPQARYLERLLVDVRAALAAQTPIAQAIDSVSYDHDERWLLAERFHKRNVTAAYAELEWDE